MFGVPEITVQELKAKMDADDTPFVLDVRSSKEYETANIGGTLIPLDEVGDRIDELKPYMNSPVVVHCRSGARSARAVMMLQAFGFADVKNLRGGTLAWSKEIDPSVPTY